VLGSLDDFQVRLLDAHRADAASAATTGAAAVGTRQLAKSSIRRLPRGKSRMKGSLIP
jgi:hypothetical protein